MDNFTYTLLEEHGNSLNNNDSQPDLCCDGTVKVYGVNSQDPNDPTGGLGDQVCYANVSYTINDVAYQQKIMNVPFQDSVRLQAYIQYFVNDQVKQLGV